MAMDRSSLRVPTLPKETVNAPAIGGDVTVRGMRLSERLAISGQRAALARPRAGETQAEADARAGGTMVPLVLASAVLLGDGEPAYSVEEWEAFGAREPGECMRLFDVCMRLSGHHGEEDRKNS